MPGRHPAASFWSAGPPSAQMWQLFLAHGLPLPLTRLVASPRATARARCGGDRLDHHRTQGARQVLEVGAPQWAAEELLHLAGVAPAHLQAHQAPEGGHDARALGVGEGVHDGVRRPVMVRSSNRTVTGAPCRGPARTAEPCRPPTVGCPAAGPRPGARRSVVGPVLDGADVEGRALVGGRGVAHPGRGRSTSSYDHSSLWTPTGGAAGLLARPGGLRRRGGRGRRPGTRPTPRTTPRRASG